MLDFHIPHPQKQTTGTLIGEIHEEALALILTMLQQNIGHRVQG